jgi:hypothetical protein
MTDLKFEFARIAEQNATLMEELRGQRDILILLLEKAKAVEGRNAIADANPSLQPAMWDQPIPEGGAKWSE